MRREVAKYILRLYAAELKDAPCSKGHHLAKHGGLLEHLYNVTSEAVTLDPHNETLYALTLIHDIGKARTYKISKQMTAFPEEDKIDYAEPAVDHLINTIAMIEEVSNITGYHLTQEELHALQFHHGGWSPFAHKATLTELAIKLHYCDMLAAIRETNGYYESKHI